MAEAANDGEPVRWYVPYWKMFRYGYELWRNINGFPPDYYKTDSEQKEQKAVRINKFTPTWSWMSFCLCLLSVGWPQAQMIPCVIFRKPEFIQIVRSYHPIAKQANLLVERARAELTASGAGFDPVLYMSSDRKTFDGKKFITQYAQPWN